MKIVNWLLDLLFPRRASCMGCGSMVGCDRDDLCEECREQLAKSFIGVRMPERGSGLAGVAYAYPYRGPAGSMVRRLKYGAVWLLAEQMGREIARAAELMRLEAGCVVTAVPMHPKRLRTRGRNHSALLAQSAAEKLDLPYMEILKRTRNAPQQARLSDTQRRENLKGGFAVCEEAAEEIRGKTILLIDDVWTTGATAGSCAEALHAAGAGRIYFASYAYGKRKEHGKDHQRKKSQDTASA